ARGPADQRGRGQESERAADLQGGRTSPERGRPPVPRKGAPGGAAEGCASEGLGRFGQRTETQVPARGPEGPDYGEGGRGGDEREVPHPEDGGTPAAVAGQHT